MSDQSEQENIIKEAKALNPDVSEDLVLELSNFLNSEFNKTELSTTALKQVSENLLRKLK